MHERWFLDEFYNRKRLPTHSLIWAWPKSCKMTFVEDILCKRSPLLYEGINLWKQLCMGVTIIWIIVENPKAQYICGRQRRYWWYVFNYLPCLFGVATTCLCESIRLSSYSEFKVEMCTSETSTWNNLFHVNVWMKTIFKKSEKCHKESLTDK